MAPRNRRTDGGRREQTDGAPGQSYDSFHTGYLRIDEDHLYRTGIRGCKKYTLYCLVTFLFIVTLANLIITVCIIGSFRISYQGAEAFELVPSGQLWRVFYDVDAKSVAFSEKGLLGGRAERSLPIDTYDSSVHISSSAGQVSKISVQPTGTRVTADRLSIVHPATSQVMFSSDAFSQQSLNRPQKTIGIGLLKTPKLSSPLDEPLRLESDRNVYLTGMEGVVVEGSKVTIDALDAITFSATDGSVSVGGPEGVSVSTTAKTSSTSAQSSTYKVCVCAESGLVFLSSPGTGCVQSGAENPCAA